MSTSSVEPDTHVIEFGDVWAGNFKCQWFVACDNWATHWRQHPIIDPVPCCDRCAGIVVS